MTTWKEFKEEQLQSPDFKKEYDALKWEFDLVSERQKAGLSQQELSNLTGITQADISKIENGKGNPSVNTLRKIAKGLGKNLQIQFV